MKEALAAKRFREDLFYRLSVIEVRLPPLRARLGDVPLLAEHFLERVAVRHSLPVKLLSDEAVRCLLAYDFPGNVRELENMIERGHWRGAAVEVLSPAHILARARRHLAMRAGLNQSFLELPFKDAVAARREPAS